MADISENRAKTKRAELLSPAGSFEGFIAALRAGADAVYAGGESFSARAYAKNFTDAELLEAIDIAHLYGKRLYLTVNTLCKEKEFDRLGRFITPFYERGLDAVIVQDIGIVSYLKRNFPLLPVHASTQMTITGINGACYAKAHGMSRVVPARELSLAELKNIRNECDVELETFIHGAMCYSYSGQCLFSSFLGGRSGNRGRCAQPCRQAYEAFSNHGRLSEKIKPYLLSMKDMCTIDMLPELMEAGISSFKIEGRMKQPEYTYFVTKMYRKYMDMYYETGKAEVSSEDYEALTGNFVRTKACDGYYHTYNSPELITLQKPSYASREELAMPEGALNGIRVSASALLRQGEKMSLTASAKGCTVIAFGDECMRADKRPLDEGSVIKQLKKTGGSFFEFDDINVILGDDVFMPLGAINELRRAALSALKEKLLEGYRRRAEEFLPDKKEPEEESSKRIVLTVLCESMEQLGVALLYKGDIGRIYVESSLILEKRNECMELLCKNGEIPEFYIALPYILRDKDAGRLAIMLDDEELMSLTEGFLVRSYDELYLFKDCKKQLAADAGLYSWNSCSARQLLEDGVSTLTLPLELNLHELKERGCLKKSELVYYGRTVMMISAGCILKTTGRCQAGDKDVYLKDRYNKAFPVICDCTYCYNRILNSVPLFLRSEREAVMSLAPGYMRLHFSTESADECEAVLSTVIFGGAVDIEYTKGHFRKSAL